MLLLLRSVHYIFFNLFVWFSVIIKENWNFSIECWKMKFQHNGTCITFSHCAQSYWYWKWNIPGELGHDDVIKWKHFPRYWPSVRGIHRWPVNSLHKGQWRGASLLSLISAWINCWVNNSKAGDLIRHRAHYDVILMPIPWLLLF